MRQLVRVVIYNSEEDYSATIRNELLKIDGVQIVAEVDEIALVEQAISQFPAEILLIHLDPTPEATLPIAVEVAKANPHLAVFVLSESTDGQHVLTAMRGGVKEFLTKPIESDSLADAVQKIKIEASESVEIGKIISILGTIGGAGASVLATNLAVELSDLTDKPVALVDFDFRYGQLATMLDVQADYTVADLCDTPEHLDAPMVERAMVKHGSGVHLLARPHQFSQADQITAAHGASVLSTLQQMYEYVVVDGPIRFDPGGLAVLDMADTSMFVIQLLVTSVRNVHRMIDGLREGGYNLDRFKLICNRVGRDSAHLELSHVEQTLNMKIAHQLPDDWKSIGAAVNMGVPLKEHAPKARLRLAIREMAESIIEPENIAGNHSDKGGLLGKIFSGVS